MWKSRHALPAEAAASAPSEDRGELPVFLAERPRSGLLEHVCTPSASVCLCPCIFIGIRVVHGQHHVQVMQEHITNIASLACHLVFVWCIL